MLLVLGLPNLDLLLIFSVKWSMEAHQPRAQQGRHHPLDPRLLNVPETCQVDSPWRPLYHVLLLCRLHLYDKIVQKLERSLLLRFSLPLRSRAHRLGSGASRPLPLAGLCRENMCPPCNVFNFVHMHRSRHTCVCLQFDVGFLPLRL